MDGVAVQMSRTRWSVAVFFAFWTLIGLLDGAHSYLSYAQRGDPLRWPQAVGLGLGLWYCWGLLSLGVYLLALRFPLERHTNWWAWAGVHLAAGGVEVEGDVGVGFRVEHEQLRADPLGERTVDRAREHHAPLDQIALGELVLEPVGGFGCLRVLQLHDCRW